MDDFYGERIIDRYKNPIMRGTLDAHDYSHEDDNPLCGDQIRIDLRVDDERRITEAAFSGAGCVISQVTADLLVESVVGMTLDEVKTLNKEDILKLLGIELGPVRLKCALLSLNVMKAAISGIEELKQELA